MDPRSDLTRHAMTYDAAMESPVILFCAFNRHNFGDLLFPHIAATLLRDENPAFTAGSQGHFLHCINPDFKRSWKAMRQRKANIRVVEVAAP